MAAQEFNAIDRNFIRQRAGYNIPVGNRPPTMGIQARSPLPGFYGRLAGASNRLSNFQPQTSLLYRTGKRQGSY